MISLVAMLAFTSIDAAAIAGLREAEVCSQGRRECGGVVYIANGLYHYTTPITQNNPSRVDLGEFWKLPNASKVIVADFHTHPCVGDKPLNNFFSHGDIASNQGLNDVGYMLSLCDHYVRRWAPDDDVDDEEVDFHSGRKLFLTRGHIVGSVL